MDAHPTMGVERSTRGGAALGMLLGAAFLARLVALDQPIVENYVGRQIPTAMVARNLERGSGFLNPALDVAPFPNRFLVEPPIYAESVVAVRRATGLPLEAAGRVVSAFGIVLAGWGLFGLAARREGKGVALGAVAVFLLSPVTLRYGRSFQPDALMLGCLVAGLRRFDEYAESGGTGRLSAALGLVSIGLALKVVSAYALIPLSAVILKGPFRQRLLLTSATLVPSILWYTYAAWAIAARDGSSASADNGGIWLSVLVPVALLKGETYRYVGCFLLVRAFTPLGPPLALAGLFLARPRADALWIVWGASALSAMAALAGKLHHEYYWLSIAPLVAVGVARGLAALGRRGRAARVVRGILVAGGLAFLIPCSASTWRTPDEWATLREAARQVGEHCADRWIAAPEALLFASGRKGCRLELTTKAARRAAGEWRAEIGDSGPIGLIEFYRRQGACYFADVRPKRPSPERLALHDAVRRRYNVIVDRPGVLIAELFEPDPAGHPTWPPKSRRDATTGR